MPRPRVNFRLIPGDTQASVTDHVRSTIANDRISIKPFPGNTDPPPVTATASPSFQMLNRTIREIFPDVIVAPGLMVAATDSRHYTGDHRQDFPLLAGARQFRRSEALPRHQRAPQRRRLCRHDPVLPAADRERGGVRCLPRHCERSEAIHSSLRGAMDCVVAVAPLRKRVAFSQAMTRRMRRLTPPASAARESRTPRAACSPAGTPPSSARRRRAPA